MMKNINNFYLIPQLKLEGGLLKCRPIGSRYVKKVHFRQGELDGACGLYSVAMCLNILGVFDSDLINATDLSGLAREERKFVDILNDYGLYRLGLTARQIVLILNKHFSSRVIASSHSNSGENEDSRSAFAQHIIDNIDNDLPTILMISYPNEEYGHWIVVVGYQFGEDNVINKFFCLDSGVASPKVCYWNGILNWSSKSNNHMYYTQDGAYKVLLDELITIDYAKK